MPSVQHVEDAIGEDYRVSKPGYALRSLLPRDDLREEQGGNQGVCLRFQAEAALTPGSWPPDRYFRRRARQSLPFGSD